MLRLDDGLQEEFNGCRDVGDRTCLDSHSSLVHVLPYCWKKSVSLLLKAVLKTQVSNPTDFGHTPG
jgi:hypothetical protein